MDETHRHGAQRLHTLPRTRSIKPEAHVRVRTHGGNRKTHRRVLEAQPRLHLSSACLVARQRPRQRVTIRKRFKKIRANRKWKSTSCRTGKNKGSVQGRSGIHAGTVLRQLSHEDSSGEDWGNTWLNEASRYGHVQGGQFS